MEPYYTPPATPQAQAFNLPEWKLPPYEKFGRGIDSVFTKTDTGYAPKKPTFNELLQYEAEKNAKQFNQTNPIGEYSKAESEGFNNPALPYDPSLNMADVYAKYDPVTWGDAFEKAWDVTTNNSMSGTQNLWSGLTEGISQGRVSAIWDNKYSQHLAEITDNLEKLKPMYFEAGKEGSTEAWLKQMLPSAGYLISSVAEMSVQTAGLTIAGAAVGAITGEGVGAIPGAVVGFGTSIAKNIQTAKNAITGINNAARVINTLSTANKIKKGVQLLGSGLLAANGEAALNAQMASRRALEEAKKSYFQQTGRYLSGDELLKAEDAANKVGSVTAAINLPLIAASNLFQFSNLVRGKGAPTIMEKLAFKIDPKTGQAVAKNALLAVGGRFVAETAAEGGEEFAQGVIEDATVDYFRQKADNHNNYVGTFVNSMYQRTINGQGLSDFLGGVITGGLGNAVDLRAYNSVKKNTETFVNDYNASSHNYFHALANAVKTDESLKKAVKAGDSEKLQKYFRKGLINMVNAHARAGSTEAFSQTLDAMDQMDNQEFIQTFGLSVSPEEQATIMTSLSSEYKAAVRIREDIDTAYQINPFESENWFRKQLNKFNSDYSVDNKAAAGIWESFKDILTSNVITYDDTANLQRRLYEQGSGAVPEFAMFAGIDVPVAVADYEKALRVRNDANLPAIGGFDSRAEQRLLTKLSETSDVAEKYKAILDHLESITPGAKKILQDYNREAGVASVLLKDIKRLQTTAGQRKAIKKIIDYTLWYEKAIAEPAPVAAAPSVAIPAAPTPEAVPITPEAAQPEAITPEQAVPQAVTPVIAQPQTIQPQAIDEAQLEEEYPELPDLSTVNTGKETKEVLEEFYTEGVTEDQPAKPVTAKKEEKTTVKTPTVIDPEMPKDLQVDEAALNNELLSLQEGEKIVPNQIGVEVVTPDGKIIEEVTRKDGELVGKVDGKEIPLQPEPLTGLEVSGADDTVNVYAAENNLTPEQRKILDNLLMNNNANLECT